jgi:hypothetical protein
MIGEDLVIPMLLNTAPEFKAAFEEHISWFDKNDRGLGNDVSAYGRILKDFLNAQGENDLNEKVKSIFQTVELLLEQGNERVQTIIVTCLLENLSNYCAWGKLSKALIFPYLGERSKKYWVSWEAENT